MSSMFFFGKIHLIPHLMISLSLGSSAANERIISYGIKKMRSSMSCHSIYSSRNCNLFDIATCHEFGKPCVS